VSLFRPGDTYVTTHSTSLLQAAQMGLRFFYLAVNGQRLHRPFRRDDPVLGPRTADSAAGLAALLDADEPPTSREELAAWIEYHVGPVDGRCTERVEAALRAGLAQPEATSGRNLASPVGC
jgi:hypothetical protein